MGLSFLKDYKKKLKKNEDIVTTFDPPGFWYSVGNYAVNKIISGSYFKGIPQGRITCLAGPSGCLPESEVVSVYIMKTMPLDKVVEKEEI